IFSERKTESRAKM
ncbi:phosphomethylpyrimidine kinase family protein, partial [Vibrio parahaemolyticus VPTS-2010_2]